MLNRAHGLRANHPIFTTPLSVDLTLENRKEDAAAGYEDGTWLVHEGEFPKVDVGMVSDGHGFEDSPDCERIAGGVNSKGPRAVAIGRQANLLQWGFYGAPDRMTAASKRAFLNAIVWMKQFDGQRPLVKKTGRGRTWFVQYIDMLEKQQPAKDLAKPPVKIPGLGDVPADATERLRAAVQPAAPSVTSYLVRQFPQELVADGVDIARLRQWYGDNEEYFGPGKDEWQCAVDADLAAEKLSNRKPEFLDWLLAAFARDPKDEKALRLAARYLGEHGRDAAAAKAFIEGNREYLFFSDTAGFRWLVDENKKRAAAAKR